MAQKNYKPHYEHLKNKWTERHRDLQKNLWVKHADALHWLNRASKHITSGYIGGVMMLGAALGNPVASIQAVQQNADQNIADLDKNVFLIADLANKIPHDVRALTPDEEERISGVLTARFGFKVSPELEGKRLNRSYGYIGAEQHLMRYPGDTMATHFDTEEEAREFYSSGMAPGRGAWGYFAPSFAEFTQKDKEREKYYIAVQTFLSPGFLSRVNEYYHFFKYRKMLVVNPHNGRAVVAVIGDAGPAAWTGKHLGGSPEVMRYLQRVDGRAKGPVLYFFIDDPKDTIPLGPIRVQ